MVSGADSPVSAVSPRSAPTAVYVTAGCLALFLCIVAAVGAHSHNSNAKKKRQRAARSLAWVPLHRTELVL